MTTEEKKIFILDTNVILHDSSCLYNFGPHDLIIPITVIEELDKFKKGNQSLNYHAREFLRALDHLSEEEIFDKGAKIGEGHGNISVVLESPFAEELKGNFHQDIPDHHILNTAYKIYKEQSQNQVIFVSKDVNLRLKAKSIGLPTQDYKNDQIKNISSLYKGRRLIEDVPEEIIDSLYEEPCEIEPNKLELDPPPLSNEYIILRNGKKKSILTTYNPHKQLLQKVEEKSAYGIVPKNSEQTFAIHALTNPQVKLVSLTGKSGTGKTLLALAGALERRNDYHQILMARPIIPLSNKDLGFLPGDVNSKLDPYMQPLYDNLGVIKRQFAEQNSKSSEIQDFLENEKLIISPLSYIRGRSLVSEYFIVDEAQNLTPHEVKTIITRAGEQTKIVFTGDINQIDHAYLDTYSNGLSYLIEKMQGENIYAHIHLEKGERSELSELASDLL